ncbi:MAG: LysR family transcriptional regulator [Eubacteriales bacterium]|nr:LysR family transcriptional regulator [Eubacteriales bacterium]
MNTQQLESFVQVAENLNFARAAEVLNITQSAVSRQINSLEEELGTRLFQRSTRTVSLTPAGISFLDDAKEILKKLQIAALKIQNHTKANVQIITIGCSSESNLIYLSRLLYQCRLQIPEIHPFVRVIPSRSILNLFIHGDIHVLFGFQDDIPVQEGVIYKELIRIPICCAIRSDHPFAKKEEISESELLSENIIICNSYEIPSNVASIQNRLENQHLPCSVYYCESIQVMLSLVKAGYGLALLPDGASVDAEITYVPLSGYAPLSNGIFYKKGAKNSLVKKFTSIVQDA